MRAITLNGQQGRSSASIRIALRTTNTHCFFPKETLLLFCEMRGTGESNACSEASTICAGTLRTPLAIAPVTCVVSNRSALCTASPPRAYLLTYFSLITNPRHCLLPAGQLFTIALV